MTEYFGGSFGCLRGAPAARQWAHCLADSFLDDFFFSPFYFLISINQALVTQVTPSAAFRYSSSLPTCPQLVSQPAHARACHRRANQGPLPATKARGQSPSLMLSGALSAWWGLQGLGRLLGTACSPSAPSLEQQQGLQGGCACSPSPVGDCTGGKGVAC